MISENNHHEIHISSPDQSQQMDREAVPPPAVLVPRPTDEQADIPPSSTRGQRCRQGLYGMPLVWRGLRLLAVAFGIAGIWFAGAWIRHGRMPLIASGIPFGDLSDPILPPEWLIAILVLLAGIAIAMMLLGTQDDAKQWRSNERTGRTIR